jgi:hypothetical protein
VQPGFASATTPAAWYGRQGGPRIRCEGHLSFQACITIQEEHFVSQNEDVAGWSVLLIQLSARSAAKLRGRLTQRRHRCLFLPLHSPPFHAREASWRQTKRWLRGCGRTSPKSLREYMNAAFNALPQSVITANLLHAGQRSRARI